MTFWPPWRIWRRTTDRELVELRRRVDFLAGEYQKLSKENRALKEELAKNTALTIRIGRGLRWGLLDIANNLDLEDLNP